MATPEAMADLGARLQAFEAQMAAQAASHTERLLAGEARVQQLTLEMAAERDGRAVLIERLRAEFTREAEASEETRRILRAPHPTTCSCACTQFFALCAYSWSGLACS